MTDVKIAMASADGPGTLYVWVKNDGSTKIPESRIVYTDVYFGDRGSMARASANSSEVLRWTYALDDLNGDGDWGPGETLQITVTDRSQHHLHGRRPRGEAGPLQFGVRQGHDQHVRSGTWHRTSSPRQY